MDISLALFPPWCFDFLFALGERGGGGLPQTLLYFCRENAKHLKLEKDTKYLISFKKSKKYYIAFEIFCRRQYLYQKYCTFYIFSVILYFVYFLYYLLSRLTQISFYSWWKVSNLMSRLTRIPFYSWWKVPKYEVFSGPYFFVFGQNTGKGGQEKNSVFGHFSRSENEASNI